MSDRPTKPIDLAAIDSRSSVIERVGPVLRRKVDQAIVDRQPATYKAVYEKFGLQVHGVSFTAFYYYARKVRTNAALVEMARLSLPDDQPVDKFLPEIVGQRFLEAALEEETTPSELLRLANAHRIAIQNHIASHRFAAEIRARAEARDIAPIRARAEARDIAPIRARAEARGNTDGSEDPAASGNDDGNLHLLENYIAALERDTKARQQAAQAEIQAAEQTIAAMSAAPARPLVRESLLAPTSEGIRSHVPSAPADPPPADIVPHSSRVQFTRLGGRSAFPAPRPSSPDRGAGALNGSRATRPPESPLPPLPPVQTTAAAYVEDLLRQPRMQELGLPSTAAEFAESIRHLAPGIADAISPARSRLSTAPPSPVEVEPERPDGPGTQESAEPLVPRYSVALHPSHESHHSHSSHLPPAPASATILSQAPAPVGQRSISTTS